MQLIQFPRLKTALPTCLSTSTLACWLRCRMALKGRSCLQQCERNNGGAKLKYPCEFRACFLYARLVCQACLEFQAFIFEGRLYHFDISYTRL